MRDHGYFKPETGKMEAKVRVGSRPLGKSQLIDARPGERNGDTGPNRINAKWFPRNVSWTHFYGVEDGYSRIDFILLSPGMAGELDRANSWIPVVANWGHGSDHRPVVATFTARDK